MKNLVQFGVIQNPGKIWTRELQNTDRPGFRKTYYVAVTVFRTENWGNVRNTILGATEDRT